MDTAQFERLISVLESINERLASAPQQRKAKPMHPIGIRAATARETMALAHAGSMVTIAEARATLNLHGESDKAVSQLLAACGFERRRGAAGVRFAIVVDPGSIKPGRKLHMPDNLEAKFAEYQKAPRKVTASQFLGMCYGHGHFGPPHIAEAKRLYPGAFTDN